MSDKGPFAIVIGIRRKPSGFESPCVPAHTLPESRIPIHDCHQSEYIGWVTDAEKMPAARAREVITAVCRVNVSVVFQGEREAIRSDILSPMSDGKGEVFWLSACDLAD